MLNVVIVGTGEMASSLLLGIKEAGHNVVGFFRRESLSKMPLRKAFLDFFAPSDFYMLAKNYKIPEIKAHSVNSEKFRHSVRKLHADVVLVATWGEKLSQKTINTPKLACINCHPSMLPAYRGPNPYMAAICNGEDKTGITFHLMDTGYDTGAILLQKEVPILLSDNGYTLKLRCAQTARCALKELLDGVENGSLVPIEQDESQASYYSGITNKDIYIDFSMDATDIYNKVRGFEPWASCYLRVNRQFLKIGHAKVIDLRLNEFFVKNKKYRMPDVMPNINSGKILARGSNWMLCTTTEPNKAILLYNLKLYGFCKQFLTKSLIYSLK
ncbi:MAG: methionyl-tRNA formyltransferase [bacterium]|nr:methionyl-tRNA formyltransferase [bacterium]